MEFAVGGEGGGADGAPNPPEAQSTTKEAVNERNRARRLLKATILITVSVAGGYPSKHRDDLHTLRLLCAEAGYILTDAGVATKQRRLRAKSTTTEDVARIYERERARRLVMATIFTTVGRSYGLMRRDDIRTLRLLCADAGYDLTDAGVATKKTVHDGGQAEPSATAAAEEQNVQDGGHLLPREHLQQEQEEEAAPGINLDLCL